MDKAPKELTDEVARLRSEIDELAKHFSAWDDGSSAGGRILRSKARRITLAAKRLEALVSENTYHKGGV